MTNQSIATNKSEDPDHYCAKTMHTRFHHITIAALAVSLGSPLWAQNWQTVDDFTYATGGFGNARAVFATPSGDVYVAGWAGTAGNNHAILRGAKEDQLVWTTLDDFVYPSATGPQFRAIHVTSAGAIFTAGNAYAGTTINGPWFIRRSIDHGVTWQTVDDFWVAGRQQVPVSITSDQAGILYAIGYVDAGSASWILRVSSDAGQTWHTTNSFNIAGVPAQIISCGSDLFAAGIQDDGSGNLQWTVQQSSDGGGSWQSSDLFQYAWRSAANSISADANGNLYAAGSGQFYGGPTDWIVRQAEPGGMNWGAIDVFESGTLQGPNNRSAAAAVAVDRNGSIYVTGSANYVQAGEINGPSRLATRQFSPSSGQWTISDDYLPPGASSAQGNSIAISPSDSVFVAGYATLTNSHWMVRKLAGSQSQTAPTLQISFAANLVSISWSVSATNYILQTSTDLGPSSIWTAVSETPQTIGDHFVLTFGTTNSAQYFRLAR